MTATSPKTVSGHRKTLTDGEVVAWSMPDGHTVSFAQVRRALTDAGLDETMVRKRIARHALARACHDLAEKRIVRILRDEGGVLALQFNEELLAGDHLEFPFLGVLELDKKTGTVSCPERPDLAKQAQDRLDDHADKWTVRDVSVVAARVFDRNRATTDLFSIKGGTYFVPASTSAADLLDQVGQFLVDLGGTLNRLPVSAGSAAAKGSLARVVTDGVKGLVADLKAAVAAVDDKSRKSTVLDLADRFAATKFKLEVYAEHLADQRAAIEAELARAQAELAAKTDLAV